MSIFTFGHENRHKRPAEPAEPERSEPERHAPTDEDVIENLDEVLGLDPSDSTEGDEAVVEHLTEMLGQDPSDSVGGDDGAPLFDSQLAGWIAEGNVQEELARLARRRRRR